MYDEISQHNSHEISGKVSQPHFEFSCCIYFKMGQRHDDESWFSTMWESFTLLSYPH